MLFIFAFTVTYKVNLSKQIKDPNVRSKNIQLLEENIGNDFFDICYRNIFVYISPQAREIKVY